jgi:hypothetical protein
MILTGKQKNSETTCIRATLSTTNATWTDMGATPELHERPATNHLCYVSRPMYNIIYRFPY